MSQQKVADLEATATPLDLHCAAKQLATGARLVGNVQGLEGPPRAGTPLLLHAEERRGEVRRLSRWLLRCGGLPLLPGVQGVEGAL